MRVWMAFAAVLLASGASAVAQAPRPVAPLPDLAGVYQTIADGTKLPGGLGNTGSPADISVTADAARQMKTVDLKQDPAKLCQPVGVFRMMARNRTKIELVPVLAKGMIVMLFEDVARGNVRTIHMNRAHPAQFTPNWQGDSIGRWDRDTLVVDTVGFNERSWLNDAGAAHSDSLHVVERVRPILEGKYLEYRVTADDANALAKPYTYVRYFERVSLEIMEDICEEER